jgi:hypothetical protein
MAELAKAEHKEEETDWNEGKIGVSRFIHFLADVIKVGEIGPGTVFKALVFKEVVDLWRKLA